MTPSQGLDPRATRQGRYLSLQAGGIQDSDPGPTAGPHGVLQAQQGADGPRSHSQAHGRALQVPGDASWRDRKEAGQQQGVGDGKRVRGPGLLNPREPRATAVGQAWLCDSFWPFSLPLPLPQWHGGCSHLPLFMFHPLWGLYSPLLPPSLPLSLSLSSVHSFHTHLVSTYSMPGPVLGAVKTEINQTQTLPSRKSLLDGENKGLNSSYHTKCQAQVARRAQRALRAVKMEGTNSAQEKSREASPKRQHPQSPAKKVAHGGECPGPGSASS